MPPICRKAAKEDANLTKASPGGEGVGSECVREDEGMGKESGNQGRSRIDRKMLRQRTCM